MDLALNNLQKLICHKPKQTMHVIYMTISTFWLFLLNDLFSVSVLAKYFSIDWKITFLTFVFTGLLYMEMID